MLFSFKNHLLICILVTLTFACGNSQQSKDLDSIVIEVTGENFNWHYRYPGLDGILGNEDDQHSIQDLYLPNDSHILLKLNSKDYIYTFAIPDIKLKEIAVPELNFQLEFKTGREQVLQVLGDQFCGYAHETLIGKAYIRNKNSGFYGWSN